MKIITESTENRQSVLNIEVEPKEMEDSLDKAYHRLVKKVNIPGFRKGKAPRSILEHYIGKEELQEEALDYLVPILCNQAIEEKQLKIIARPQIEVLQLDPVMFKAIFSLRPQVELGEYRNINLTPETFEVSEEQVDKVIEQLRERNAIWNPVDHPIAFGDMAVLDIEEKKDGDSVNTYPGQQYPVIQDSYLPLPGFAEQLVGLEKGSEKEFSLSYPEDYPIKELAGTHYDFKVVITEVKEKDLPEPDDNFAKSLGENFETLDALRDSVTTNLKNMSEDRAKGEFERRVIDAVVNLANVEFPPILVEQEIDRFVSERERMLGEQGGLESYLKNLNKTEEEMREELRPEATRSITQSLVLGKVAEEEKIEASAQDIDAEIESMLQSAGDNMEEMRKVFGSEQGRSWIEERLIIKKTIQCLTEIATGNGVEVATDDSTKTATDDSTEVATDNTIEENE